MQTTYEKYLICNTLVGILNSCVGKCVQIDLRDETHVYGRVEAVFAEMNVIMSEAQFFKPSTASRNEAPTKVFNEVTIRGRNIRFVHVPDEVDMIGALQRHIFSTSRLGAKSNKKSEFKKRPRNNPTTTSNSNR